VERQVWLVWNLCATVDGCDPIGGEKNKVVEWMNKLDNNSKEENGKNWGRKWMEK
jgi:hypothetical protein